MYVVWLSMYHTMFIICSYLYSYCLTSYCLENFITDIRCDNLLTPANGSVSCTSGRVGVGYTGDTCSFTCNTGYELTGSDTRTCQSGGSWSGSDNNCIRSKLLFTHCILHSRSC